MQHNTNLTFNHINVQVFHLLEDLEAVGDTSFPRGFVTKEANLATLDINPLYSLMDFNDRHFNFKYFAGELAWYLKAETSIDFINNFSSFWKDICSSGHANSNYGTLVFKPYPSTEGRYYNSSNGKVSEEVNQLEWVFNSLVKDKYSRQAVAFFSSPHFQYPGNKDFVCTLYVSFWIKKDFLDMKVQMRSNDIFFGLTYDAPWFSTLHQSMYLNLKEIYPDLKLGIYYHCADNIHFYERHFETVEKILDSNLPESTLFRLKTPLFKFFQKGANSPYTVYITKEASDFQKKVEEIVNIGEVPKDQLYWKKLLSYLYDFTGDSEGTI